MQRTDALLGYLQEYVLYIFWSLSPPVSISLMKRKAKYPEIETWETLNVQHY